MLKRSGHIDHSDVKKPGKLAVQCVSCPRAGVNLPPNWKDNPNRSVVVIFF
jgi:hypothetical protein